MALKYFMLASCLFLGGTVACVALARSLVVSLSGARPLLVSGVLSLVMAALAAGIAYTAGDLFTAYWRIALLFAAGGVAHMLLQQRYFTAGRDKVHRLFGGKLLYALSVLCCTVFLFLAVVCLTDARLIYYLPAMPAALSFFIPLFVVQCYGLALRIPAALFTSWQYPPHGAMMTYVNRHEDRVLVIALELAKSPADRKRAHFRAKAREDISLGDMFCHFINDYNQEQSETPIVYLKQGASGPYSWLFRRKPAWYQRHTVLDPTLSLYQNGVRENTVIVCERIDQDAGLMSVAETY